MVEHRHDKMYDNKVGLLGLKMEINKLDNINRRQHRPQSRKYVDHLDEWRHIECIQRSFSHINLNIDRFLTLSYST